MNRRRMWPGPVVLALSLAACGGSTSPAAGPPSNERPSPAAAAEPAAGAHAAAERAGDPATPATEPAALPHQGPGLEIGQQALLFSLKDQTGQVRSLDQWLGQGPVALVFFRSADW
ncbi:MAG: hypothetical protein AAGF11_27145 [Myxococcota bacterium]